MKPGFDINKSKYFVMMRGEGFGESGVAVGISGRMKPINGKIVIKLHNRSKLTEQLILYKKALVTKN